MEVSARVLLACGAYRLVDQDPAFPGWNLGESLPVADDDEVLFFIERHRLMGRGIGYIDAHLLASTAIHSPVRLWTRGKHLFAVAGEFKTTHPEKAN